MNQLTDSLRSWQPRALAWWLTPRVVGLAGTLLVFLCGLLLLVTNSPLALTLRHASYDWLYDLPFSELGEKPVSEMALVYLDDASHVDLGQPLNQAIDRVWHARLLDRLTDAGARAVVFDIVFSDPGPSPESDAALAAAIRRNGRVVLAADLTDNHPLRNDDIATKETELTLPYPLFAEVAARWGLAQIKLGEDLLAREHHHGWPDSTNVSLCWATAQLLDLPVTHVPAGALQERWINYYSSPDYIPSLSYKAALETRPAFFKDRIVIIGGGPKTRRLEERRDEFRNPHTTWFKDPFIPAVQIHATMLLNLERGDWLNRLPPAGEWAVLLAAALIFGWSLTFFRPTTATLITALGVLTFGLAAVLAFKLGRVWIPWLLPVAVQAPAGLVWTFSYRFIEWYAVRRGLEEQRRAHEARIREQAALLDKAQDAILVHDLDGRTTYLNPSATRLYGWTAEEALGRNLEELLCRPSLEKLEAARAQVQKEGEWTGQLRQMTKDEREVLVESRWTRVNNDAGQPKAILVINTDITEKHKLQLQLLRSQRMESIGTLAGGIAHDLNNVLTPVIMATQLMKMQPRNESDAKLLRNIEVSAQRGAGMVKQVLAFARGQEGDMAVLQLKHIIREMEKIMRETFPKTITIKTHIATDLLTIKGDATQLHQILLNLCVNARDAMPNGGELLIKAENVTLDEAAAGRMLGAKPGAFVSLRVTDTGTGMPPEVIDRIFEPFFTTKEVGKGTGLGLSTVMSIIKSHSALIDVTSTVGKGTTFSVLFPPAEPVAISKPAEPSPANAAGDGRLVLVVDDEPLIRTLTETVLTQEGFRVLEAEDGLRGLTLFKQHATDISVVMIDMMMPVMGGQEAMRAMRRIRPDVPFIAISGLMQAGEMVEENGGTPPVLLQKPFTSDKILETLRKVMNPRAAQPVTA